MAPAIGDWTTYKPLKILVKKVKTGLYGFDRLSKEDLNQALTIHYRFLQEMLKRFKVDLGMAVELFALQIEQTTYPNFLRNLNGPIVQGKISLENNHDPIQLVLALPLANSMINYALGSHDLEPVNRALTESENNVLQTTLTEYLPLLSEAFAKVISEPSLAIVSSPDIMIDPAINPSATFVIFCADVALADNPPGRLYIAYNGQVLKNLLGKYQVKEQARPLNFARLPTTLLQKITVPVKAILGETELTTTDIHRLEVGDVVALENPIDGPISATIGKLIKLLSQPGNKNKKAAIRIVGLKETTEVDIPPPELATPKIVTPPTPPPPIPSTRPLPKPAPVPPPKPEEELPEEDFDEELTDEDFLEEDFLDEDINEEEVK
jgi:flagellar motor switch protein FliM